MKGDGNESGKLELGERGYAVQEKPSTRDRRFHWCMNTGERKSLLP